MKECIKCVRKKWVYHNKAKIKIIAKRYRDKNKHKMQEWRSKNKDKIAQQTRTYYLSNKEKIDKYRNEYKKNKRISNPSYKLRSNISRTISRYITISDGSKNNNSCLEYLSYTINELRIHLEFQFESWMTWDNYGIYQKTWNDHDPSTWTWNIDHIMPQSKLPYDSMDHPNFKKCWSLSNLRPLSAKQNLYKGANL